MKRFYKKGEVLPRFIAKAKNPKQQSLYIFGVDCTVNCKKVIALKSSKAKLIVLGDQKFRRGYKKFTPPESTWKNVKVGGAWSDYGVWFLGSLIKRKEALNYKYNPNI
tara:strand:+ start:10086 stop:10409 length:324 start_codon:yes stop_codon:yes gene_type:complete